MSSSRLSCRAVMPRYVVYLVCPARRNTRVSRSYIDLRSTAAIMFFRRSPLGEAETSSRGGAKLHERRDDPFNVGNRLFHQVKGGSQIFL